MTGVEDCRRPVDHQHAIIEVLCESDTCDMSHDYFHQMSARKQMPNTMQAHPSSVSMV